MEGVSRKPIVEYMKTIDTFHEWRILFKKSFFEKIMMRMKLIPWEANSRIYENYWHFPFLLEKSTPIPASSRTLHRFVQTATEYFRFKFPRSHSTRCFKCSKTRCIWQNLPMHVRPLPMWQSKIWALEEYFVVLSKGYMYTDDPPGFTLRKSPEMEQPHCSSKGWDFLLSICFFSSE